QKLFAVCRTQQLEKHLQSSRRNCIVGCENKRADVLVMTISVVLMVVMAMDVRIGFGGKPFLDVRDFPVGIIKPTSEQLFSGRFALSGVKDRRRRIERA